MSERSQAPLSSLPPHPPPIPLLLATELDAEMIVYDGRSRHRQSTKEAPGEVAREGRTGSSTVFLGPVQTLGFPPPTIASPSLRVNVGVVHSVWRSSCYLDPSTLTASHG